MFSFISLKEFVIDQIRSSDNISLADHGSRALFLLPPFSPLPKTTRQVVPRTSFDHADPMKYDRNRPYSYPYYSITVLCWLRETNLAKTMRARRVYQMKTGCRPSTLTSRSNPPLDMFRPPSNSVDLRSYRYGLRKEGRERSAGFAATLSGIDLRLVESLSVSRYPLSLVQLNNWTAR